MSPNRRRTMQLHRLFSAFPAGLPGVGLLLLRVVVGAALVAHGVLCLASSDRITLVVSVSTALLLLSGGFLLIGFLTPILSLLGGLECLGIVWSWFPFQMLGPFESNLAPSPALPISVSLSVLAPPPFPLSSR